MQKTDKRPFTTALILAAGSGTRMSMGITKQKIQIFGKSVLRRSVEVFDSSFYVDSIIVVCREDEEDFVREEFKDISKLTAVAIGGKTRSESAKNGFRLIEDKEGFVLIHDAARCLITESDISAVAKAAYEFGCATAANCLTDTVKSVDEMGKISGTLDRRSLITVQTPQAFSCGLYERALNSAKTFDGGITDDNMLIENLGEKIHAVMTSRNNIKITTADDLCYAEFIIGKREQNS